MSDRETSRGPEESAPLADLLSGDPGRVLDAAWTVFASRDSQVLGPLVPALPEIRRATAGLELGGMFVPNSVNLAHALDRVALFGSGACLCGAYLSHMGYDPAREEQRQHVRVLGTVPSERQPVPDRVCECRDCGRRFQVEEGESHYTWWKWTALP